VADIGVHAFHLAEFVTGLRVTQILADLGTVVPGRLVDDDCQILLRFDNGARGPCWPARFRWVNATA
jgi:predicted dehydrogenase